MTSTAATKQVQSRARQDLTCLDLNYPKTSKTPLCSVLHLQLLHNWDWHWLLWLLGCFRASFLRLQDYFLPVPPFLRLFPIMEVEIQQRSHFLVESITEEPVLSDPLGDILLVGLRWSIMLYHVISFLEKRYIVGNGWEWMGMDDDSRKIPRKHREILASRRWHQPARMEYVIIPKMPNCNETKLTL